MSREKIVIIHPKITNFAFFAKFSSLYLLGNMWTDGVGRGQRKGNGLENNVLKELLDMLHQ